MISHLTVPVPVPALVIVRLRPIRLKVAVTELLASIVKVQGEVEQLEAEPLPELKPAKVEPGSAVALSLTEVPLG